MREIKFRAFDSEKEEMLLWENRNNSIKDGGWELEMILQDDSFEVMQYTGLKDKNGKEIFENDIVKIDSWEPKIHEVVFDRGAFCFRSGKDDNFYNDCKYLEQGEVIGNVFENPELLTNIN